HLLESASVGLGGAGLTAKVAATFFVGCLRGLADLVSSDLRLTAAWAAIDDERKFAVQPVEALLRARLLALPEVDSSLARALLVGRSQAALELVLHLTKACVLRDHTLGYQELMNCIEALFKVSVVARSTSLAVVPPTAATTAALAAAESHMGLVEQARKLGAASITSNRPAA
ncbi:CCR4-Not complex component, Not1-domain-containing protein, partial [Haematococcus lacustris]